MFRDEFKLTANELKGLRNICLFIITCYIEHWFQSGNGIGAAKNDIEFLKKIQKFKLYDHEIGEAAYKKFANHLWYLSEEMVRFSFFDSDISDDYKIEMCNSLNVDGSLVPIQRIKISGIAENIELKRLVSKNTMNFFHKLNLPTSFLALDPSCWNENQSYKNALKIVKQVTVTNDHAERGVALIENFNGKLTKDEDQLQYLLQVVKEHQKKFPNCSKSTLQH